MNGLSLTTLVTRTSEDTLKSLSQRKLVEPPDIVAGLLASILKAYRTANG